MAPGIPVIIIDSDPVSRKNIEGFLKSVSEIVVTGTAGDYATGHDLVVKSRPMVVIIELDTDPAKALDTMGRMLRHMPNLIIIAASVDSSSERILSAMRGGASEFLLRPVEAKDLFNSMKKVCRIMVPKPLPSAEENGKVITCFSPKGGMGNTTVATNLAVTLYQATGKPVVLVDLDLEGGDASMFLNLKTRYTISDVTANIARLDRAFLEGVLSKHSSGIFLLAEPQRVEEAEDITASQVREVLDLLKMMFAYIVVDTEIGYGDRNLAAFDSSDLILVTGVLSLPAIKNIQKSLEVFERLRYGTEKVKLIINRYLKKGEISIEDAERTMNHKIFRSIPNDYNDVMMSINRGTPLTLLAPGSEISHTFTDLAKAAREYLRDTAKNRPEMFAS